MPISAQVALGCAAGRGLTCQRLALGDAWYAWSPKPDKLPSLRPEQACHASAPCWRNTKARRAGANRSSWTPRYDAKWIQAAPGDKTPVQYFGDDRSSGWCGAARSASPSRARSLLSPPRASWCRCRSGCAIPWRPWQRTVASLRGDPCRHPAQLSRRRGPAQAAERRAATISKSAPRPSPTNTTRANRPYRDFFKDVVAADPVTNPEDHLVMADEANMANIIRGPGVPTPPPAILAISISAMRNSGSSWKASATI